MRIATIAIALSLLMPVGCGTPVAAADNAGDLEAASCAAESAECAAKSECSEEKAAECSDEAKAECAAKCEAEAEAGTN